LIVEKEAIFEKNLMKEMLAILTVVR
jgi:hypothetical protein